MAVRFTDQWLDELRARTPAEELIGEYVRLKPKGRRYWGLCPFHNEKTPSFSVDAQSQLYYCFGCHRGGTVFNFIMDLEHLEFAEAVSFLADRAHMELPQTTERERTSRTEKEKIYEVNRFAAQYFHDLLWKQEGAGVLSYLHKRGLDDRDIRKNGLGAAPEGWDTLLSVLEENGYPRSLAVTAGLAVERDGRYRDMFRGRAIFPIIDAGGKVLGFGGRAMGDAQPKYLNTPDTPVFNKRFNLYGLNFARQERASGHLVLVEGYMDVVSLRKHGVPGVVATLGTALTEEQARLMKRYTSEVWISYDGDSAGQKAALRALDILEPASLGVRVLDYPEGMDPDDFIRAKGSEGFAALPRIEGTRYRMLRAKDGLDLTMQEDMTKYAIACCNIIRSVRDPVEAENHLRALAHETGYDEEVLRRQIGTSGPVPVQERKNPRPVKKADAGQRQARDEGMLLALMATGRLPEGTVSPEDLASGRDRSAAEWILSGRPLDRYIETLPEEERAAILTELNAVLVPEDDGMLLNMARECLRSIRDRRRRERIEEIRRQIPAADEEKRQALMQLLSSMMREDRM